MSVHKLVFFAMLAPIVVFTAARILTDQTTDFAVHGAKSEVVPAAFLPVQSKNPQDLAIGKLLVASRDLGDPIFAKTVVLLVRYDRDGVVGLMLNRRTDVPLSRVFEKLKAAKDRSDPVYMGGPVEIPAVFGLLRSKANPEEAEHVFGGVYLISTQSAFEKVISGRPDPGAFHVYLGYAGWTPDQLGKEIEAGAWFIFPGDTQTVFNSNPDSLWPQMIRKTELKMADSRCAGAIQPVRESDITTNGECEPFLTF
jgi:putative AlgH/UPF0301 family transcriptional regulator